MMGKVFHLPHADVCRAPGAPCIHVAEYLLKNYWVGKIGRRAGWAEQGRRGGAPVIEMFLPSSSCRCLLGGPALLRGLLGVCMNRSTKEKTPWSTDMILNRLSSFQAAFSSSAMRPAHMTRMAVRSRIFT